MAAKKESTRIPRGDGAELLLAAAADLARDMPVAKVTVRDIASRAGLQTMHVKRYFGGRNELLLAVSNRLMARIVEALQDKPLDKVFPYLRNNPDVSLRLRIVNHLQEEGMPPSSFANDRALYLQIAERIAQVNGVGTKTARTYAMLIQLVLQGDQLMGRVDGITPAQRRDIFDLLVGSAVQLPAVEKMLGWRD